MRIVQPVGIRGSLRWIQRAVNEFPDKLQPATLPKIDWLSPRAEDGYAEYRDRAFLRILGLGSLEEDLQQFWPRMGPQWDALGRTERGPVLVEAKAHIGEFLSPASKAGGDSARKIAAAFAEMQDDLGISAPSDWCQVFFQYANRLAFLWWLRSKGVKAELIFVDFLNDTDVGGPSDPATWHAAFMAANHALGITGARRLLRNVHHVMPDVADLQ